MAEQPWGKQAGRFGVMDQQSRMTMNNAPTSPWDAPVDQETALRLDRMAAALSRKLGPEYIANRTGAGNSKVSYIEAHKAVELANEIFGFNGWSTAVKSLEVDFLDYDPESNRWNIGVSAIVRITLVDGSYREDVGCGKMENSRYKAEAIDKAKKEAVTDATKRALRNFGSLMGSCLYDKQYLALLKDLKAAPKKLDMSEVHRPGKQYPDPPKRFRTDVIDRAGGHESMQAIAGPSRVPQNNAPQHQANKAVPQAAANNARPAANNQKQAGHGQQNAGRPAGNANQNNASKQNQNVKQEPIKQEMATVGPAAEGLMDGNNDDTVLLPPPDADEGPAYDHELEGIFDDMDEADLTTFDDGIVDDSGFVDAVPVNAGKPGMPSGNRRGSLPGNQPGNPTNNGGRPLQNQRAPSAPIDNARAGNCGQMGNSRMQQQQSGGNGQQQPGAGHNRRGSLPENTIQAGANVAAGVKRTFDQANADNLAAPAQGGDREVSPLEEYRLMQEQQERAERAAKNREEAMAKRALKLASGQAQ